VIPYARRDSELRKPHGASADDDLVHTLPSIPAATEGENAEEVDRGSAGQEVPPVFPPPQDMGGVGGEDHDEERASRNLRQEAVSMGHILIHKLANKKLRRQ
jgi:hypothetical protein